MVEPALLERRRQREERLARARAPGQGEQLHLRPHERVEGEDLLGVARLDAVGRALADALERARLAVVVRERAQAPVAHHQVLVRKQRAPVLELGEGQRVRLVVQPRDRLAREPFPARGARVQPVHVAHLARRVVLGQEAQRLRLDAEVDVLADQDDLPVLLPLAQLLGEGQDAVVGLAEGERLAHPARGRLTDLHEEAAALLAEGQALGERPVAGQLVQLAYELSRLEVDEVVAPLEAVQLLQDHDGQRDVVLREVVDARVIEEDDVGVDHEELLHLPSRALARRGEDVGTPADRAKSKATTSAEGGSGVELTAARRVIRSRQP